MKTFCKSNNKIKYRKLINFYNLKIKKHNKIFRIKWKKAQNWNKRIFKVLIVNFICKINLYRTKVRIGKILLRIINVRPQNKIQN